METHITDRGSVCVSIDYDTIDRLIEQSAKEEGLTVKQYRNKYCLDTSSEEDENEEERAKSDQMYDNVTELLPGIMDLYRRDDGELSDCMKLLIHDVQGRITPENKGTVEMIIENAKKEMYHDMLSELDAPSLLLAQHLSFAGLTDLYKAHTVEGKYDAKAVRSKASKG